MFSQIEMLSVIWTSAVTFNQFILRRHQDRRMNLTCTSCKNKITMLSFLMSKCCWMTRMRVVTEVFARKISRISEVPQFPESNIFRFSGLFRLFPAHGKNLKVQKVANWLIPSVYRDICLHVPWSFSMRRKKEKLSNTQTKSLSVLYLLIVASLLATCNRTFPERIFLNTEMASAWDIPWRARPFTAKISSPATNSKLGAILVPFFESSRCFDYDRVDSSITSILFPATPKKRSSFFIAKIGILSDYKYSKSRNKSGRNRSNCRQPFFGSVNWTPLKSFFKCFSR